MISPVRMYIQGEKVVPESINRLHEIAREVEDKKQFLLGTTVEAAMSTAGTRISDSSADSSPNIPKRTEAGRGKSNQIKSNQIKSNQIKSNQIKERKIGYLFTIIIYDFLCGKIKIFYCFFNLCFCIFLHEELLQAILLSD